MAHVHSHRTPSALSTVLGPLLYVGTLLQAVEGRITNHNLVHTICSTKGVKLLLCALYSALLHIKGLPYSRCRAPLSVSTITLHIVG